MMQGLAQGLLLLLTGSAIAIAEGPPPPDAGPNPAQAPPSIAIPTTGLLRADQPVSGPLIPLSPAQALATLEAGRPLFPNDPGVATAAVLLTQLTAAYVEDAPRIAEITIRVVREVRATNQAASPLEVLVDATRWKGPPGTRGNLPRKFVEFAGIYRKLRREAGKDHATASP